MKKLLSLLSLLTISGTAVSTTIAASPYKKVNELNRDINYQQTNNLQVNNLENLNRVKRENNNILHLTEYNGFRININDRNSFKESHNKVFKALIENKILKVIVDGDYASSSRNQDYEIVIINKNSEYNGFIVPVIIENNQTSKKIELVFRTENFYLDGFIINNNYYHFKTTKKDGSATGVINSVNTKNSVPLLIGGDYGDLFVDNNGRWINLEISWNKIFNSFDTLSNYQGTINTDIRNSLGVIAVVVSENWRFRTINNLINKKIIEENNYIVFGKGEQTTENLYQSAMQWNAQGIGVLTAIEDRYRYSVSENGNFITGIHSRPYEYYYDENHQPRRESEWSRDSWKRWFNNVVLPNTPINTFTDQILSGQNVRILFLIAVNYIFNSCHQHSDLRKREINDNLNQKFCSLESEVKKIKGVITSIQILDENTKGGDRQAGDAYVGTTEGLYLIRNSDGFIRSYNVFNSEFSSIVDIKLDCSGGAYVLTNQGKYFHLFPKNSLSYTKIEEIESSNLEKEIKLFYDTNHNNKSVFFKQESGSNSFENFNVHTFNLGPINPLNYKKIEFIGEVNSNGWGVITKWGDWSYRQFNNNHNDMQAPVDVNQKLSGYNFNLQDIIKEEKIKIGQKHSNLLYIQSFEDSSGLGGSIKSDQTIGFSWYKENGNYYLQLQTFQYLNWWTSTALLYSQMKIGSGVRLYND